MRLQVERDHGAAAFLLADEQGFADGGVLRWSPGQRERLHNGEALHRIDRKTAGADDIADYVDQPGAAHLHGVAGAEFGVVVGRSIGSAGIKHNRDAASWDRRDERRSPGGPALGDRPEAAEIRSSRRWWKV